MLWGALGTLLITFPMYFLLQFATFPILVATMIIGGILPTMAWAALGGLMNDLFPDHFRYSALSFAYALAATVSGFVPYLTLDARRGDRTSRGGIPGVVLAILSAITLVSAWLAAPPRPSSRSWRPSPRARRRPRPQQPDRDAPTSGRMPAARHPLAFLCAGTPG